MQALYKVSDDLQCTGVYSPHVAVGLVGDVDGGAAAAAAAVVAAVAAAAAAVAVAAVPAASAAAVLERKLSLALIARATGICRCRTKMCSDGLLRQPV